MADNFDDGTWSFTVSSGAVGFPLKADMDGTITVGGSNFLTSRGIILERVLVEALGSADGVLTISDDAATTATDLAVNIPFAAGSERNYVFGCKTPWTGIKGSLTGTGQRVRIFFRAGA